MFFTVTFTLGLREKSPLKEAMIFGKLFIVAIETLHNDKLTLEMADEVLVRGATRPNGEKPNSAKI